ncbi:MAG: hypothetical protein AAGJ18_27405 [Bacteroidota bacterium]
MEEKKQPLKQPQKPIKEKKKFQQKLDKIKGVKCDSLQEFIKLLDALD